MNGRFVLLGIDLCFDACFSFLLVPKLPKNVEVGGFRSERCSGSRLVLEKPAQTTFNVARLDFNFHVSRVSVV